jgi:hypothetical protein
MGSHPHCRLSTIALYALLAVAARGAFGQVFVVGEQTAEADVTTEFHPTHIQLPTQPLSQGGYLDLIRNLEAEQGFAHRELPLGAGLTLIANGNLSPHGEEYKQLLYKKGASAGPGERVAITSLKVERDRIILDVNGGPYAQHRFLSHISLNDMPLAQQGPLATGARITLVFEGGVPEVTAAEVKALLDPVIDFRARSASEAYSNTLAPVVREAVQSHRILVGMDRRMVLASVGAPKEKQREHANGDDPNSPVLEEWIYGEPPVPIQFVRFRNGRVVRLEIAAIGKPIEIHDKNEMGGDPNEPVLQARTILNGDDQRAPGGDLGRSRPPSLARPGEVLDSSSATMGKVLIPGRDCTSASSDKSSAPATPSPAAQPGVTQGGTASTPPPSTPCPDGSSQTASKTATRTQSAPSAGTMGGLPNGGLPGDEPTMGGPATSPSQPGNYPGGNQGSPYPPMNGPTLPGSGGPIGPTHLLAMAGVSQVPAPDGQQE